MMTIQKYWPKMLKNCQTMTPGLGVFAIVSIAVILSACSTSPKPVKQAQQKQPAGANYQPLTVQTVATGLAGVYWDIDVINGSPASSFMSRPYLYFMAGSGQLSGSTGCNALSGRYREAGSQLHMNALAGHMNCGGALAQEAELMDSLARISGYQLNQNVLQLFDANNRVLIRAHKR